MDGDDLGVWPTATKMEDGTTYYCRVNTNEHKDEAGLYITHIYFYNSVGSTLTTAATSANIPTKNTTNKGTIQGESIIAGIRDNEISTGCYNLTVIGKTTYAIEVLNVNRMQNVKYDKESNTYTIAGAILGTATAGRMAVLKCDGNLEIYGTITTAGEDVYLWKNSNGTYEYVPATGASGGASAISYKSRTVVSGNAGQNGTGRQTGGGGSGMACKYKESATYYDAHSGAGGIGTSYSGGSGGGGCLSKTDSSSSKDYAEAGVSNGGKGGQGNSYHYVNYDDYLAAGGGAGNPGGYGEYGKQHVSNSKGAGETGTGGLIIIYANTLINKSTIISEGKRGGFDSTKSHSVSGGSSGGGSINVFYKDSINRGTIITNGGPGIYGLAVSKPGYSGAGGTGAISIGNINSGSYTSTYTNY